MSSKKEQIVEMACRLMEVQGYHATGLSQILDESAAPKGSLYYYFPDGKEGLAVEAVEVTGQRIEAAIRSTLAAVDDPAEAVASFIMMLADRVAESGYRAGGPITAIAVETVSTNERLRQACRDAYRRWQRAFADKLAAGGREATEAGRLAGTIVAALEGAILLSRSERSAEPLRTLAGHMAALVRQPAGG
jgi:TetR/AcrR family transcriptional repressor of lmrAB and yxaGH operons